jgi:hypothetical protein
MRGTVMNNRKGLLMRVGIDQTFGKYNAPVNPETNDYIYMPIPQEGNTFTPGMEKTYNILKPHFESWCQNNGVNMPFPPHLIDDPNYIGCHLDPDFDYSTYGDQATGRGLRVGDLKKGDFIAFFASFKPIAQCEHKLIYALYGIMFVDRVERVADVSEAEFHKNAHTRVLDKNMGHLVVFADPTLSGRFDKAIPIGEFRNGAYRVTNEILEAWGGLGVKDGFIQRSVCPPRFTSPAQFMDWLDSKRVKLINSNWE